MDLVDVGKNVVDYRRGMRRHTPVHIERPPEAEMSPLAFGFAYFDPVYVTKAAHVFASQWILDDCVRLRSGKVIVW